MYSRVSQKGRENITCFEGAATRALYNIYRENAVDSSFAMHNHFSIPQCDSFEILAHSLACIDANIFAIRISVFYGGVEYLVTNKAYIRVHEEANGFQNPERTDNIQSSCARAGASNCVEINSAPRLLCGCLNTALSVYYLAGFTYLKFGTFFYRHEFSVIYVLEKLCRN